MRLSEALDRRRVGRPPLIGLTPALKEVVGSITQGPMGRFVRADLDYVESVAEAGGVPVVLEPVIGLRAVEALLEGLDGLLLSGGSDLDPAYYDEKPIPQLGVTIPEWDTFEMTLLRLALRRGIPIFGICRGMQILNVALGGTLYQDVPSQLGADVLEHRQERPKWQPTHEVEVLNNSCLAKIADCQTIKVNSYHHQGIKGLADTLAASARSFDGMIEGVESRDFSESWVLGVQWHPEGMRDTNPEHRNLFEAHVCAAERHALLKSAA